VLFRCYQDGPAAGQTVDHVHIHILPRKAKDFPENDQIYAEIEKSEKKGLNRPEVDDGQVGMDAKEERPPRTPAEMEVEAKLLRPFFQQHIKNLD
jgi:bis(5'-adenosyl)-triphosphatase